MSDIVWAVDPRKDRLADLLQRMRQAAYNLLEANGVRVEFIAPADERMERIALAPDRRRHLYLIFRESVTNVARHAGATRVQVEVRVQQGSLLLEVTDDGCGFDPEAEHEGHGLRSLRQRASEIDASIGFERADGRGSRVRLRVPLRR
jgi:signal transduction histidine kinase